MTVLCVRFFVFAFLLFFLQPKRTKKFLPGTMPLFLYDLRIHGLTLQIRLSVTHLRSAIHASVHEPKSLKMTRHLTHGKGCVGKCGVFVKKHTIPGFDAPFFLCHPGFLRQQKYRDLEYTLTRTNDVSDRFRYYSCLFPLVNRNDSV